MKAETFETLNNQINKEISEVFEFISTASFKTKNTKEFKESIEYLNLFGKEFSSWAVTTDGLSEFRDNDLADFIFDELQKIKKIKDWLNDQNNLKESMKKSILKSIIKECISELKINKSLQSIDRYWINERLKEYKSSSQSEDDFDTLVNSISKDLRVSNKKIKEQIADHLSASEIDHIEDWKENDFIAIAREVINLVDR